jgi:glutamyl-tRNA synthetase
MSSAVRVRFAPSPTGFLHIGGAPDRAFQLALRASHRWHIGSAGSKDTDEARNTAAATQAIYDGLRWLGLEWDEGPQTGGDFGPYFQSERNDIYERHLAKLKAGGHLFEEDGAVRFRSPREHVVVDDVVCGKIDFDLTNPETHPDMTIRRPGWFVDFSFRQRGRRPSR